MPILAMLENFLLGIFRFVVQYILIGIFFDTVVTVVTGTGKLLIRPFVKRDPDLHYPVAAVVVGLAFWMCVAIIVVQYLALAH